MGRAKMASELTPDLCVIGAGSAGLTLAAGAARFGVSIVLIERAEMGGECLNSGCVPSKALLAAAKAAHAVRSSGRFGVESSEPLIDYGRVRDHVRGVIATLAPIDSAERFEGLGVRVLKAEARFVGPRQLEAGGQAIRARRIVIATGSRPAVPEIPGLDTVPFMTNETVFHNEVLPEHLVVIGGGPIGIEMGQAYRRLGSRVTILEASRALPKDDPELAGLLLGRLDAEGIDLRQGAKVQGVTKTGPDRVRVRLEHGGKTDDLEASHLLVATGRRPNVESLDLAVAGVKHTGKGIVVDERLRTSAGGVYAIGDVVEGPRFTHVADYHAKIVLRNVLFRLPAKVGYRSLPWVTYTDPELAQAGMTEDQAKARYGDDVRVVRVGFDHNDRAQTERETGGLAKIIARRNGRVLGASILGAHAGELIHLWVLAIERGIKLKHVAGMLAPYPTLGQINTRAAGEFYGPKLFNRWSRGLVRALSWVP